MHKLIGTALMAVTLSATTGAALAQQISQTRQIDARVLRVTLGGIIDLRLKQGPTASLVIATRSRHISSAISPRSRSASATAAAVRASAGGSSHSLRSRSWRNRVRS